MNIYVVKGKGKFPLAALYHTKSYPYSVRDAQEMENVEEREIVLVSPQTQLKEVWDCFEWELK